MDVLLNVVNYILGFGAAVFVPLIMFILGLAVKMKPGDAFIAALTLGVAFTGMNVLTGFMTGAIQPAAEGLATKTGIVLTSIDTGWPAMSAIAWAWPFGVLCFPLLIVINIIMLVTNKTNTLNVDLWNVWNLLLTAVLINFACTSAGMTPVVSMVLAFVGAGLMAIIGLKIGDAWAPTVEKLTGIPGVTVPHSMTFTAVFMLPFEKLLEKIPAIENQNYDAKWLRNKLGIFGENAVMGLLIGIVLGFVAYDELQAALTLGIQAATAMQLFPMVSKLFMQALSPISDAVGDWMKNKFNDGRELYIGLDWPIVAGSNELWVLTILLIPFEIILAVALAPAGNTVLPFAGIVNICVAVPALFIASGNLVKMFILGLITTPVYLLVASSFAPACTQLAQQYSPDALANMGSNPSITWSTLECPDFRWAIANGLSLKPVGIIVLIIWLVGFVWLMKEMSARNVEIKKELNG
ncbi:PTS galactitol transporter subunit IIC [Atopobium fossor]|uniref:PTS galactitol transporter subunit IIC n=1 Tax=Atopobium fossor TaxID=39487 RepID=UPI000402D472|nr:PTS transporter subunit IIC [Atopobium fossor]